MRCKICFDGSGRYPGGCAVCHGSGEIEPTEADYDDMHHALGRPKRITDETYRNYYCTPAAGETARRFEALGWWDFSHTINGGRDAIYTVNGAGGQALTEHMAEAVRRLG